MTLFRGSGSPGQGTDVEFLRSDRNLSDVDDANTARQNLGLVSLSDIAGLDQADGNFIVGDGTNWVAESGATARSSMGVSIGTDVQAHDVQLDDISSVTPSNGIFVSGDGTNFVGEYIEAADYTTLRGFTGGVSTGDRSVYIRGRTSEGDGGEGRFLWRSGNQSANITADPQEGVWVAPSSDATGASGAWERVHKNVFHTAWWGVASDGTDQASKLQAVYDFAVAVSSGTATRTGEVVIDDPGGVITQDTSCRVYPGLTIRLRATIQQASTADNFRRVFTTEISSTYSHSSADDSDIIKIIFEGGSIDGNNTNRTPYTGFEKQQSHAIQIAGDPSTAGRTRAVIIDPVIRNTTGDAVSIVAQADVEVRGGFAQDCFRGGVVPTGGGSKVRVSNFRAYGSTHATGVDIEVDVAGNGSTLKTDVQFVNVHVAGDFDVTVDGGSVIELVNCTSLSPPFTVDCKGDATLTATNCLFHIGAEASNSNRIVRPGRMTFNACRFIADEPVEATSTISACRVAWSAGTDTPTGQRLMFNGCFWDVAASVEGADNVRAIKTEPDDDTRDNWLIVNGGVISSSYDVGLFMERGGFWVVSDVANFADVCLDFVSDSGSSQTGDITISGGVWRPGTTLISFGNNDAGGELQFHNFVTREVDNVLTSDFGVTNNDAKPGRLIIVTVDPTGTATPGIKGDIARIDSPGAGGSYEWVCTAGDTSNATWKLATGLAT